VKRSGRVAGDIGLVARRGGGRAPVPGAAGWLRRELRSNSVAGMGSCPVWRKDLARGWREGTVAR
jgi:hypothetical protein